MDKSNDLLGTVAKIKKESGDEDINEYAETAMNELLGWYGYGATSEDSKIPPSCVSQHGSNSSDPESPKYADGCDWCGKPVDDSKGLSSAGATFCSELCFSQSRRANFKKNKTCDWCKHVRHTVSYVDFQDGASQLQFCSDKCLNQYKMHIFCRETRAHLEMHPHIPDDSVTGGGLITPDLWLKNCKSPEPHVRSPSNSPKTVDSLPQTSPIPLITVAHPSKFMISRSENLDSTKRLRTKVQKRHRKKCPSTITTCSPSMKSPPISEIPQDLRVRHTPPSRDFGHLQFKDEYRPNMYNRNFVDSYQGRYFNIPEELPAPHSRYVPSQMYNPPQFPLPSQPARSGSLLPPITVLVPYPIVVPLPLPIPIPIPILGNGKSKLDEIINNNVENKSASQKENNLQNLETDEHANKEINEGKECVSEKLESKQDVVKSPVRKRKRLAEQKQKLVLVKNKNSVPV